MARRRSDVREHRRPRAHVGADRARPARRRLGSSPDPGRNVRRRRDPVRGRRLHRQLGEPRGAAERHGRPGRGTGDRRHGRVRARRGRDPARRPAARARLHAAGRGRRGQRRRPDHRDARDHRQLSLRPAAGAGTTLTAMALTTLRFEREGAVGWLWLSRPDRLNSFTPEMWRELREVGEELREDPELRALVVIGEGRAFSSGIDTSVFAGETLDGDTLETDRDAGRRHDDPAVDAIMQTQDSYTWLEEAPYATIAAVRRYALGAGLQLALACDVRVFAEGTKAGLLEFKYGILPDLGGTQRLPRAVGAAKAKELIFTAGQIDAEEAFRIGLTQRLVPDAELEPTVRELAATIAAQPPLAVEGAKRAVNVAGTVPTRDGLRIEAEGQAACLRSDDMKEAIAAFVEQRAPSYQRR